MHPISTSLILRLWEKSSASILRISISIMLIIAIVWLGYQFSRLLWLDNPIWPTSPSGAVDLIKRHVEIQDLISGQIYNFTYPPATFLILWPVIGHLEIPTARLVWGVISVISLVWLVYLTINQSRADTKIERIFVGLIPLSLYSTGAAIGNGQLTVILLPLLLTAILLIKRNQNHWQSNLLAASLMTITLVKPNISAPFFWLLIFLPGAIWPALFSFLLYVFISFFALSFINTDLTSTLESYINWYKVGMTRPPPTESPASILTYAEREVYSGEYWGIFDRHADLGAWFSKHGLGSWYFPVKIIIFTCLGVYLYYHRYSNIWLIMGITSIITLFLTYSRWYDDLLMLIPAISLFRVCKLFKHNETIKLIAGILFAILLMSLIAPGGLYLFTPLWSKIYAYGQFLTWISVLIFLFYMINLDRNKTLLPKK